MFKLQLHSEGSDQRATADRIVSTLASFAGPPTCPAGQSGWYRQVQKIVTDQNGADIVLGGQELTEVLFYTRNDFGNAPPTTGSGTTNSNGNFTDTFFFCTPACPNDTVHENDVTQDISDHLPTNGVTYALRPNALVYKCSGITINGN